MIKAINTRGQITVGVPKRYRRPNGEVALAYNTLPDSEHFDDGWKAVTRPELSRNEFYGPLLERDKDFIFEVLTLSPEAIKANALAAAETARLEALQIKAINETAAKVEAITDPKEALENQKAFRVWDTIPPETLLAIGFKCQDFVGKELKLFNCKQAHEKREDRRPADVKALWDLIEFASLGIEIWSQPDGGSGKYLYLDPKTGKPYQVIFNGNVWENAHNAGPKVLNVWKPGEFGWKLIGPAPK